MKLKPNTEDAKCLKCKTRWFAHSAKVTYCGGHNCTILKPTTDPNRIVSVPRYPPEHLHCTCKGCGYEWLMECADAEQEDEPSKIPCPYRNNCPTYHEYLTNECADATEDKPSTVTIKEAIFSNDCPHRTRCVEQVFKEFPGKLRGY